MKTTVLALAILSAANSSSLYAERLTPVGLRTEYLENPVGLDPDAANVFAVVAQS